MRWTDGLRETNAADADGKAVWSWPPDAGTKFVDEFHGRRWLTSPAHRGEHGAAVNTIVQGMPDCFGVPVVNNSYAFHFACEAAGARGTRHSLRPPFGGGHASLGRFRAARM